MSFAPKQSKATDPTETRKARITGRLRFVVQKSLSSIAVRVAIAILLCLSLTLSGCFLTEEIDPYYGRVETPKNQEFRWSDGGLPQTFDPALAAAAPDTDAVRAMFEGLTEYDPTTLSPVPGVALRWESSADGREWTFYLRPDAKWSNGDTVTARDFVRSWQRSISLGSRAPHVRLMENIVGAFPIAMNVEAAPSVQTQRNSGEDKSAGTKGKEARRDTNQAAPRPFGAVATSDYILNVSLERSDKNFPALVAHPIFRPVHASQWGNGDEGAAQLVTNGPFKLSGVERDAVVLERANNYWDSGGVNLNRVRFVQTTDAEAALTAYRIGEVDAVTNAVFEPLALKLLAPYKDFRRATYGALTFYKFNIERVPFNDVRVREALAITVDRERISEDEMGGSSEPARSFLPVQSSGETPNNNIERNEIARDLARAKALMEQAGFPDGKSFPRIRLLINRNEQQRQIALSVAAMWKKTLGVDTDVVARNWDEYETAVKAGDYDIVRRGMVMQTTDEEANMRLLFGPDSLSFDSTFAESRDADSGQNGGTSPDSKGATNDTTPDRALVQTRTPNMPPILTEAQALKELPAIPIYFASSYALVKPYVSGFDANLLDAPLLKRVSIDTSWQKPKQRTTNW